MQSDDGSGLADHAGLQLRLFSFKCSQPVTEGGAISTILNGRDESGNLPFDANQAGGSLLGQMLALHRGAPVASR